MNDLSNNSGAKLWQKAKEIIPGGNQLLSKRAEMFLPDFWPAYYKKAKGCEIWDLDDNHYIDMSIMGIGTCVLGYAHPEVSEAVIDAVENGSMASLNCYEEVALAEKLIELHPWAEQARFARTGGESCAIAVRIARSHTKKDKIAFCGYHGWHDWYLATNLKNDNNLDEQLLPGLNPCGVPNGLTGSVLPFKEGDIQGFQAIIDQHGGECAAVVMEVFRHSTPDLAFLRAIKALCIQHNIVLIFDEISSGFRLNVGGSHLLWDVEPDICVLGKALGNGHPIGAIIGKKSVMDAAQLSFISSSYWTERVGFAAALKTIDIFEQQNVIEKVAEKGRLIKKGLLELTQKTKFDLTLLGIDSVIILAFSGDNPLLTKTVFTQEMLKRGFLASNVIYVSLAHSELMIEKYLNAVNEVFVLINQAIEHDNLASLLLGPMCHSGFSRLN
ncbi:aminotransferase class III-fold pyridoxal phosphate-dependent enzyme [Colwellia sp. D2M02]|uniref:aminotransferase class III-fold pyridoxal phosphate-dependent enzyme n=1 Tax=Colwellia sp. D2M02 TaxID=2841562 RepID=UPI001C09AA17|nr:aminotransferase class III-fold pyridoxal phosphate-dependent enzyme [Colwellia sp. D2M02]MBU2892938.1 aminotransferase class III-fold pyridoxal phosphate-dependent enzyme [Colwellia sp. D2M02]